jgi:MFS family permease
VIADSAIFKAGLTEMVQPRIQGFCLGIQSVLGFGMTIISPFVFGLILEYCNGPIKPTEAVVWWPGFMILGFGGLLAPVAAILLRRHKQAFLMAGGKK